MKRGRRYSFEAFWFLDPKLVLKEIKLSGPSRAAEHLEEFLQSEFEYSLYHVRKTIRVVFKYWVEELKKDPGETRKACDSAWDNAVKRWEKENVPQVVQKETNTPETARA